MAEIVGLITAIGTIVASGFKITRAIGAIHDDLGAATASIKAIAADTSFVTMVLGQIRDRISANRVTDSDTLKILGEIVSRCRTDIEEIESLVLPLLTNVKSGGSLSKRQRIRWLFAKSKICSQLAALGSLKLTLSLFIHTMQLSDGYNTEEFKQEILNAIHESKHTKTTFLDAERVDQAATRACEEEASDELGLAEQNSTSAHGVSILAVEHHHDDSETAMGPLLSLSKPDNAAADCEPEVADGDTHSSTDLQLQRLNMSDFEVIRAISDDSLMKIAAHMQLQKSVAAFALNTMNRRPIEHSLSPEPTSSQADPAEDSATEAVESPESPDSDDSSSMRSWSTSTAGTKAEKGRYCCLIPGCGKILNRLADLNRHYKTVHLLPQGGSPPLEDLGRRRERRAAAQGVEEMREGARQLRLYKSLYEQMRSDYENLKRQMKHREIDAADSEDAPLLETKIQKAREVANQDTEKENKELMEWKEAWEWAERFRTGNLTEREENLLWLLETTGELYR